MSARCVDIKPMTTGSLASMSAPIKQVPMILVRMRCPACRFDYRFLIEFTTPLAALPEVTKEHMRCKCKNHIPKINQNTPVEESLMSINGVPFRKFREQGLYLDKEASFN